VTWVGSKVTGSHDGGFKSFRGTIELVDGEPAQSRVSVELDAKSLYADNPKLTTHLKSADFFDAERYPAVTFTSTSLQKLDAAGNYRVTGNLTLRGVTKQLSFPARLKVASGGVEGDASFSFNRRDFGINYAGMANDLIRDEVKVDLTIRARRAQT
jgi:polyisoprenoid-binding protein YceI